MLVPWLVALLCTVSCSAVIPPPHPPLTQVAAQSDSRSSRWSSPNASGPGLAATPPTRQQPPSPVLSPPAFITTQHTAVPHSAKAQDALRSIVRATVEEGEQLRSRPEMHRGAVSTHRRPPSSSFSPWLRQMRRGRSLLLCPSPFITTRERIPKKEDRGGSSSLITVDDKEGPLSLPCHSDL